MDETEADDVVTVGQRLREAREAKGLSIEDIAAQTRIPTRHLASLEIERLGQASRRRPTRSVSPRITPPRSGSTATKSATSCAPKWAASGR